jgi:Peptidase family M28
MVSHLLAMPAQFFRGDKMDVQFFEQEVISMSRAGLRLMMIAVLYCGVEGLAQQPVTQLNPAVKKIVDEVSEERIGATMKKLESFGTRYVGSEKDNAAHGIGGAQKWIESEFKSYSPRLEVSLQKFTIPKSQRNPTELELNNIVAVLPGTIDKDRYVIISGHYDSIALRRQANQPVRADDAGPTNPSDADPLAPGVADDGSGTAATMELARVMSQYQFDKSIIFVTFAAEEIGLNGSRAFAAKAKEDKMQIEGVLNNDIIGSDISGNGRSANNHLHVFSEGPEDSSCRSLARYTKEIGERYMPSMSVDLVFRHDRFGRGGDHSSFVAQGFAAIRLTTPSENFANQHTATDTFANASVPYTTRVAKINAAVLATLALAPKPPVVANPRPPAGAGGARGAGAGTGAAGAGTGAAGAAGGAGTTAGDATANADAGRAAGGGGRAGATDTAAAGGTNPAAGGAAGAGRGGRGGAGGRGGRGPGLSRGSGYDAVIRWAMPSPEPDIAGYSILIRDTTAPLWQKEIYVGNVTEYTLPDVSIDDIVIGVRAIDKDGNPSLVSAYEMAPTRLVDANPQRPPVTTPPATGGGGGGGQ